MRWIGLALALVVVGGAAGYAFGQSQEDEPASISAGPVPAASPSYPVNEYVVVPDPGIAPLATDLPLHPARFRTGDLRMRASAPVGWRRAVLQGGDSWNFADPDVPQPTYMLRVGLIAGDRASLNAAREFRISKLEDAEANGDLEHLVVEERSEDGFTATYLSGGHLRVTMERFLPQPGSTQAYATIAVVGRDRDREGMADLLERVTASATF
ncbi:hypothetical protein ASC77_15685 [Nocardioides sp. Root1257]|nr:hypothetical protein ASC77_15685 [Nocardioides sp. Root1257]KRC45112.1 hypothetical protein ASE24_16635 [Nocardioides sp. Root224]